MRVNTVEEYVQDAEDKCDADDEQGGDGDKENITEKRR